MEFVYKPVYQELRLGAYYVKRGIFGPSILQFIQVTPKGFNLLNVKTSKCVMKKHVYSREHYGKPIPKDLKVIKTFLPWWIADNISEIDENKANALLMGS